MLSFDIECQGRKGYFPEAEKDPVIQIANCVSVYGTADPVVKNVFTLKGCLPIVGTQVIPSETEHDLLLKWVAFLRAVDCDIITGYNVQNFDIPYLLDRAEALQKARNGPNLTPFKVRELATELFRELTLRNKRMDRDCLSILAYTLLYLRFVYHSLRSSGAG